jgi:hypothetical protein
MNNHSVLSHRRRDEAHEPGQNKWNPDQTDGLQDPDSNQLQNYPRQKKRGASERRRYPSAITGQGGSSENQQLRTNPLIA